MQNRIRLAQAIGFASFKWLEAKMTIKLQGFFVGFVDINMGYAQRAYRFAEQKLAQAFAMGIRVWQRDALAILMDSRAKVEQKIEYIHLNPLQERWSLADRPENYKWSSARFYEEEIDDFGFITHYLERF